MQVASFYSVLGKCGRGLPDKTGIAVCTIEKANSLVTRMIEDGTLSGVFSAVIVDELHMVDDEDRGYLLELLLTKLLHVGRLQLERRAAGAGFSNPIDIISKRLEAGSACVQLILCGCQITA